MNNQHQHGKNLQQASHNSHTNQTDGNESVKIFGQFNNENKKNQECPIVEDQFKDFPLKRQTQSTFFIDLVIIIKII